jgi:putative ABC transport system ATP-binding protein
VAAEVLALLREGVRESGQTVVMVTHDPVAAASAQRVVFLADGRLVDELIAPTAERVAETLTDLAERVRACPV